MYKRQGVYTGRSPKDKFFVLDDTTRDTIWWTTPEYPNDNKPTSQETWRELKKIATEELSGKKLYLSLIHISKQTIEELSRLGIRQLVMLTGDHEDAAREVAQQAVSYTHLS